MSLALLNHPNNTMHLIILVFILLCAFLIPAILVKRLTSKNRTKLPPGPPKWPVVGNLLQLGQLPHRDLARLCDKYGPLVHLRLGSVDAITTNDPEIIRELLVKQDDVFNTRPITRASTHLSYGCNGVALAPMGPKWKRMRRISKENLLATNRLVSFSTNRAENIHKLVHGVWLMSGKGEHVNLSDALGAFSMNNITRMLFGKEYFGVGSSGKEEAIEFRKIIQEFFRLLGSFYLGDFLPFWRWIDPYGCEKKMRNVEKRLDDFFTKIVEDHKSKSGQNTQRQVEGKLNFVDALLSLNYEDGKEHLEDWEIKALIQEMVAAGTDTSTVTIEWAMTEVIKHPSILRKIQEELDTVVGQNRMVSETDLPHLNYLRCVVCETFRIHSPTPFMVPHEAIRATTVKGYHIPAKTRVLINTYGLGRNTKIWDGIGEFRPERHLPENVGSRVEMSHGADFRILPFGAGKRKCPGESIGVSVVLLALARLFHSFDWTPPHGMMPEDIDTHEVYGMTMHKAIPLVGVAKPRLPTHLYQL